MRESSWTARSGGCHWRIVRGLAGAGAIVGGMSETPLGDESEEVAAANVDDKAKLDDEAEAEAEVEAQLDAEAEAEAEVEPEAEGEL
jgi:hypothetical protein